MKKSIIKRRGLLVPVSLSYLCKDLSVKILGSFMQSSANRLPHSLTSLLSLSWSFISIPRALSSCTKSFQATHSSCVSENIFYHPLSVKVLGYLPILNYKAYPFLPMSTHKSSVFVAIGWVKKTCQARFFNPCLEFLITISNRTRFSLEQFSVPLFLEGLT